MTDSHNDRSAGSWEQPRPIADVLDELIGVIEAVRGDREVIRVSGLVGNAQDVGVVGIDSIQANLKRAVAELRITDDAQSVWMPIETAPRDEDLLLGWWQEWPERRWEMASGLAGSTRGGWLHGQATHWQRLPGPPDAAQPQAAPAETKPFSAKENLREVVAGVRAEIDALERSSAATEDDPTASKDWNEGCDFAMEQLCRFLGVDPSSVSWDAATETVDGDVQAVIGNILRVKFGEDWGPDLRRDEIAAGAFYKTRGDKNNLPHIVGPLEHADDGDAPWQARVYDQTWKWGYDGLANADGSPHNRDLVERVYRPAPVLNEPQAAPVTRGPDCACCEQQPRKDCTVPGCTMKDAGWALPAPQGASK